MASKREILLLGVLSQVNLSGKIDYKILARDIGAPSPGAAQKRWLRFQTQLRASISANASPEKPTGIQKNFSSPTKVIKKTKAALTQLYAGEAARADTDDQPDELHKTPLRRMPPRKSRPVAFKDELEDEKEDDRDMFDEGMNEGVLVEDDWMSSSN